MYHICIKFIYSLCSSRFPSFRWKDRSTERSCSMPGVSKKLRRSGEGVSEKVEGVGGMESAFPSVASPLPLLFIFHTLPQFSSPSQAFEKGKETAAMQTNQVIETRVNVWENKKCCRNTRCR